MITKNQLKILSLLIIILISSFFFPLISEDFVSQDPTSQTDKIHIDLWADNFSGENIDYEAFSYPMGKGSIIIIRSSEFARTTLYLLSSQQASQLGRKITSSTAYYSLLTSENQPFEIPYNDNWFVVFYIENFPNWENDQGDSFQIPVQTVAVVGTDVTITYTMYEYYVENYTPIILLIFYFLLTIGYVISNKSYNYRRRKNSFQIGIIGKNKYEKGIDQQPQISKGKDEHRECRICEVKLKQSDIFCYFCGTKNLDL
jgi:hypothetical protein